MLVPHLTIREAITVELIDKISASKAMSDNTFKNPRFIENERAGRNNWKTPQEILTFQSDKNSLVFPRGYLPNLLSNLSNYEPQITDLRTENIIIYPELKNTQLRPYQERSAGAAMKVEQGIIVAPTGSGKSLIGLEIIRQRKQKALIIVHKKYIADQWLRLIKDRFCLEAGFIGDNKWSIGEEITVALVQTLARREDYSGLSCFGLVIMDESHHAPAQTYFDVLNSLPAKYRYGLSATPNRCDGLEDIIYRAIGSVIITISRDEVENIGSTVPVKVYSIDTGFNLGRLNSWNEYLSAITSSENRNAFIADLALDAGNGALVLCDRVEHAKYISKILHKKQVDHVLVHGKLPKIERELAMSKAQTATITVGTTGLLGEGIDLAHWTSLILASPISSSTKLMQAVGRIVRPSKRKTGCIVYDLKDNCGFSGASFNKRKETYRKHNIQIIKQQNHQRQTDGFYKGLTHNE